MGARGEQIVKRLEIKLYESGEYTNKYGDFVPNLNAYLHEGEQIRPAIIIAPGGGYAFVSTAEAYIVAMPYYNAGYQVYVLSYTVNSFGVMDPVGTQPLKDMSRAVCEVRKRAAIDKVDDKKVAVIGFSAGGHLAASICVHCNRSDIKHTKDEGISDRPDASILCYSVITAKQNAHKGSIVALYGKNPTQEQLNFASLEEHVCKTTPPAFIWHTVSDTAVPVENSLMYMQKCKDNGVSVEMHLYPIGVHGISVATQDWIDRKVGDSYYTLEQIRQDLNYIYDNCPEKLAPEFEAAKGLEIEEFTKVYLNLQMKAFKKSNIKLDEYDKSVADWMRLSIEFLDKVYSKLI